MTDDMRSGTPLPFVPGTPEAAALAPFIAFVLGDDMRQAELATITADDAFVAAAQAMATAAGIAIDIGAVRAAIRPDPLGIGRWMPAPVTLERWPGRGWLPAHAIATGGLPALDWAWFGAGPITDPFYAETVRQIAARPFNRMFRTRTALDALSAPDPAQGPPPAGFVHHMSRCGSTLVAQMFAADPAHVVLSEPEPLDGVLRWAVDSGAAPDDQVRAVRTVVAALGRDRSGHTRHVVVKLESWHTLALPLLRAAFPDTPWAFVYRDPVEVLVSQARGRGIHTIPGALPMSLFAIPDSDALPEDDYAARVIDRATTAVLDHWSLGGGMLVDYRELPDAAITRIAAHFAVTPDPAARAAMQAAAIRDVRDPARAFVPDSNEKRAAATPAIRQAAQTLAPLYARLEALRITD